MKHTSILRCGSHVFSIPSQPWQLRPLLMGVVNVTPDSFSDGGRFFDTAQALAHARKLIADGADILDIGGESSRPGAQALSEEEELARVLPVLEGLRDVAIPLSIDTYKPAVMRAALAAGASMVNDIWALRQLGALDAVRASDCAICIMHMQGEPATMQQQPQYGNATHEVAAFLRERVQTLLAAGIAPERIVIDPGIGFGKTLEHNLALLHGLRELQIQNTALLVGVSRKSMLGQITGKPIPERMAGGLGAALFAVSQGAHIIRTHDVAQTRDALLVWQACASKQMHSEPIANNN